MGAPGDRRRVARRPVALEVLLAPLPVSDAGWVAATVRDASPAGLRLAARRLPHPGQWVELVCAPPGSGPGSLYRMVGRVVWVDPAAGEAGLELA